MTNPPFKSEVLRLRRWCGDPMAPDRPSGPASLPSTGGPEIDAVVGHLEPIRSRSSLLSSFGREASPSQPVRTAYAIRWIELGSGVTVSTVSRARRQRVLTPVIGPTPRSRT